MKIATFNLNSIRSRVDLIIALVIPLVGGVILPN